jgi:hypothetical protein
MAFLHFEDNNAVGIWFRPWTAEPRRRCVISGGWIERGWLVTHESGTYVKFTQNGAELFA